MGSKRPSIRTLDSGEKAIHTPDDRLTLVPENRLVTYLANNADAIAEGENAQRAKLLKAIEDKKAALDAGDAVPNDKRPL
jgi:hypothetical protein